MNYNGKVSKYNFKKNKLQHKINTILTNKINENLKNHIENLDLNDDIIDKINNLFNSSDKNILIVTGLYGVGKSTFIDTYQKNILKKNISSININTNNIYLLDEFIKIHTNIIIEVSLEIYNEIYNEIYDKIYDNNSNIVNEIIQNNNSDTNILTITIMPKNVQTYKNKLINKIFYDIQNKTNTFIENIKCINKDETINTSINHILSIKNQVIDDNEFMFLDNIINKLIIRCENYYKNNIIYI